MTSVLFTLGRYERDKAQVPSNFTLKLRKHVRTRRIEKVEHRDPNPNPSPNPNPNPNPGSG